MWFHCKDASGKDNLIWIEGKSLWRVGDKIMVEVIDEEFNYEIKFASEEEALSNFNTLCEILAGHNKIIYGIPPAPPSYDSI